jgi:hypothetical protein
MKYYSAFKKKEILPCAATWMGLEAIRLNDIGQSQKDKHSAVTFEISNVIKIIKTENREWCQGLGEGRGGLTGLQDEKVLETTAQ